MILRATLLGGLAICCGGIASAEPAKKSAADCLRDPKGRCVEIGAPSKANSALPARAAKSAQPPDDTVSVGVQWRASNGNPWGRGANDSTVGIAQRDLPGARPDASNRFGVGLNFKY